MAALTDANALATIPLFDGLTEPQLAQVNQLLHASAFPVGTNIITYAAQGDVVYIILSGTVKIKIDQSDSGEVIIALLGTGALVGELSMLDSGGRSADVIAQEDAVLLWLDRMSFDTMLESFPIITRNLLKILTRRLRLSTEQIQALCTLDVCGKVTRQLLVFAEQYGVATPEGVQIPLRLTQSDVAGLVGASRERVNQVFVNLRQRKLISVDQQYRVTILQRAKLVDLLNQR